MGRHELDVWFVFGAAISGWENGRTGGISSHESMTSTRILISSHNLFATCSQGSIQSTVLQDVPSSKETLFAVEFRITGKGIFFEHLISPKTMAQNLKSLEP